MAKLELIPNTGNGAINFATWSDCPKALVEKLMGKTYIPKEAPNLTRSSM